MTDAVDEPEFHQALGEEPEGPALLPFGRRATRQGHQVGCHLARELCGGAWWQRFSVEGCRQAHSDKAAAASADRSAMAAQGLSDGFVLQGGRLVAIQEQEDTGAGVRPGRGTARADQGVEGYPLGIC